jgi:outer membrane usher protein FimD/PapC
VAHRHGLTFSPYNVDDTFGVISLGGLSGVQLQTPNGPVWTDLWGRAVIANMTAYKPSSVQVITHTLPRNVDIDNGLKTTQAGHGAVTYMDFGVVKVRRLLLTASLADGTPLPKGSSIVDQADNFVTAAGDNGTVFVPDGSALARLTAILPEGRRCILNYQLPDEDTPSYYETMPATCTIDSQTAAKEGEIHDE